VVRGEMATESVTVLFTDLVGSTQLISRLGEDHAEVLRREHFGILRESIREGRGREVKNLGDGLMVAFDSVTAALGCAVSMQQRVDIRNRGAAELLAIRIGVSHGEADIEDGDYFGVPVVEAARLCSHAHGDQILTTELVRTLAGSRGGLEYESIGSLQLKGLDDAVATCAVVWTPSRTDATVDVALPARLASAAPAAFVGRVAERNRLEAALKSASGGERRVLFVSGEPGSGG